MTVNLLPATLPCRPVHLPRPLMCPQNNQNPRCARRQPWRDDPPTVHCFFPINYMAVVLEVERVNESVSPTPCVRARCASMVCAYLTSSQRAKPVMTMRTVPQVRVPHGARTTRTTLSAVRAAKSCRIKATTYARICQWTNRVGTLMHYAKQTCVLTAHARIAPLLISLHASRDNHCSNKTCAASSWEAAPVNICCPGGGHQVWGSGEYNDWYCTGMPNGTSCGNMNRMCASNACVNEVCED